MTGDRANESPEAPNPDSGDLGHIDISPMRLNFITAGLWICLFLSALEATIVTTALFNISNDLNALDKSSWIVVSYLLTFNAFLLIISKFSDIFGQKSMLLLANFIFLTFSIACAVAKKMTQLIVFRAFQGIGGSGLFAMVFVVIMKLVNAEKIGLYSGILSSVFAMSNLLGPLLGGVITDNTTWRWVFWLNVPGVGLALLILVPSVPSRRGGVFQREKLKRVDWIGGILSVGWAIPLIFGLEEGGLEYPWKSSTIIGTLVGGGVGFFVFNAWEYWVEKQGKRDPTFPIRFTKDPVVLFLLLSTLFMGFSLYPMIVCLPQRFQAVNGTSAAKAGILLLWATLSSPLFSLVSGFILGKWPRSAGWLMISGGALLLISNALISALPTDHRIPREEYGYEILMGAGLGLIAPASFFVLKLSVPEKDVASTTGALNMARTIGGCIGIGICAAILHEDLKEELPKFLNPIALHAILESLKNLSLLSPAAKTMVAEVYGKSYNKQFRAMTAFAAANVFTSALLQFFIWKEDKMGTFKHNTGNEESGSSGNDEKSSEATTPALLLEMSVGKDGSPEHTQKTNGDEKDSGVEPPQAALDSIEKEIGLRSV